MQMISINPKIKYTNLNNNDLLRFYNADTGGSYYDLISIIYENSGYSLELHVGDSGASFPTNPSDIDRYQLKTEVINRDDVKTDYCFRIKIQIEQ